MAERAGGGLLLARLPPALSWGLTLLLVTVGWVFFRAGAVGQAVTISQAMAGAGSPNAAYNVLLEPDKIPFFVVGSIVAPWTHDRKVEIPAIARLGATPRHWLVQIGTLALFVYSAALVATNGLNPFIYFRF